MSYSSNNREPLQTAFEKRYWQAVESAIYMLEAQDDITSGRMVLTVGDIEAVQADLDRRVGRVIDELRSRSPEDLAEQLALFLCVAAQTCAIHEPGAELAHALSAQARRWRNAADPSDPRGKLLSRLVALPSVGASCEPERTSGETPSP